MIGNDGNDIQMMKAFLQSQYGSGIPKAIYYYVQDVYNEAVRGRKESE